MIDTSLKKLRNQPTEGINQPSSGSPQRLVNVVPFAQPQKTSSPHMSEHEPDIYSGVLHVHPRANLNGEVRTPSPTDSTWISVLVTLQKGKMRCYDHGRTLTHEIYLRGFVPVMSTDTRIHLNHLMDDSADSPSSDGTNGSQSVVKNIIFENRDTDKLGGRCTKDWISRFQQHINYANNHNESNNAGMIDLGGSPIASTTEIKTTKLIGVRTNPLTIATKNHPQDLRPPSAAVLKTSQSAVASPSPGNIKNRIPFFPFGGRATTTGSNPTLQTSQNGGNGKVLGVSNLSSSTNTATPSSPGASPANKSRVQPMMTDLRNRIANSFSPSLRGSGSSDGVANNESANSVSRNESISGEKTPPKAIPEPVKVISETKPVELSLPSTSLSSDYNSNVGFVRDSMVLATPNDGRTPAITNSRLTSPFRGVRVTTNQSLYSSISDGRSSSVVENISGTVTPLNNTRDVLKKARSVVSNGDEDLAARPSVFDRDLHDTEFKL